MTRGFERIAVVGGGIVGITTAALLEANGHPTVLYALARPADFPRHPPASFASLHAAASILPHSVASPHSTRWTATSQEYFRALAFQARCAVRTQRHYEIFEADNVALPDYHGTVPEFEMLTEAALRTRRAPIRPGAASVSGWCFSAFFCEAPDYLRFLYGFYKAVGGEVASPSRLPDPPNLTNYLARDHTIYVICAGHASPNLLSDVSASGDYTDRPVEGAFEPLVDRYVARLIRGHYLLVDVRNPLYDGDRHMFSYNYTPTEEVYPSSRGSASDVYCYPRSVGWLLGGSRQEGQVDDTGAWCGEMSACEEIGFPSDGGTIFVPAPIFYLNRDLLISTGEIDVELDRRRDTTPPGITAGIGFRFVRDSEHDNVRTGVSRLAAANNEKVIVHNYGHGGAGYTLSWGCALDVLTAVDRFADRVPTAAHLETHHEVTRAAIAATTYRLLGAG